MTWRMLRLMRRLFGTVLGLVLLICGTEVGVRLYELKTRKPLNSAKSALSVGGLIVPSWSVRQELRPFTNVKVKSAGEREYHHIKINSLGMRGEEVAIPKPPDAFRILCLGDELIFSPHFAEEQLLCACLQKQLQQESRWQIEVLNGGIPGASPLTEYLMLRHRWSAILPDVVVVTLTESDLSDESVYRRFTRTDHDGRPLTCRHPSLLGKSGQKPWTAWRQEFRLVDLGMSWCGENWKRQTEVRESVHTEDHGEGRPPLRFDQTTAETLLQPLVPLAEWCRLSYATLCVCCVTDKPERGTDGVPSWIAAVRNLSERHQFLMLELPSAEVGDAGAGPRRWGVNSQRQAAEQVGELLITRTKGPWAAPQEIEAASATSNSAGAAVRRLPKRGH